MISLRASQKGFEQEIQLPGSKSESNRALLLSHLCDSDLPIENLSPSRDTRIMSELLNSNAQVLDVRDAGTVMRFLSAYFAYRGVDQILTGTPRMCSRPIGDLVEALRALGAEIRYWNQEGFPPLNFQRGDQPLRGGTVEINASVSSQFISALMMIAPLLEGGLRIVLQGKVVSGPYLEMTARVMSQFGVEAQVSGSEIVVPEGRYQPVAYRVEPDWSAASYWYAMVALSESGAVFFPGLKNESLQGDRCVAEWMKLYGVITRFSSKGVHIRKSRGHISKKPEHLDFSDAPDLALTLAVVSAGLGKPLLMSGVANLEIKEANRLEALKSELFPFGIDLLGENDSYRISGELRASDRPVKTFDDHRMAMSFAPLALRQAELKIEGPDVVEKSYPDFWKDLESIGIEGKRGFAED